MKIILILIAIVSFNLSASQQDTTPPSRPFKLAFMSSDYYSLNIKWIGSGDDGREGKAAQYLLRSSDSEILTDEDWEKASVMQFMQFSMSTEKEIKVRISNIKLGQKGYLAVRAQDKAGNLSEISPSLYFHIKNPFAGVEKYITDDFKKALVGGKEADGSKLYACLGLSEQDEVYLGKTRYFYGGCNVAMDGREMTVRKLNRYVLTDEAIQWEDLDPEKLPDDLVAYGKINGKEYFFCRAEHEKGTHIGQFNKEELVCHIPWGGNDLKVTKFQLMRN